MTIEEFNELFPGRILPLPYPNPYPNEGIDPAKKKAVVLGCDPSNFSKKDGVTKELETVFGIVGKGKDGRYFSGIRQNLKQLELSLQDIYVQNLCRNYFDKVTANNDCWMEAAVFWRNSLRKELNDLHIPQYIPVFLTSAYLYQALIRENTKSYSPEELYQNLALIPIPPSENYLERPLIPLYRGGVNHYMLENQPAYKNHVMQVLANLSNKLI
jgi:hypothetical protein